MFTDTTFEKYINTFIEKTKNNEYLDNGMFDSELFLSYVFFKELKCEILIESGVCHGYSTLNYLKLLNVQQFGIDINNDAYNTGLNLEKSFPNFKMYKGDSFSIIPNLLNSNKDKNIFISIDGPKYEKAIELKDLCLSFNNVKCASVHDHTESPNDDYKFSTVTHPTFNKKYFNLLNNKQKNKSHNKFKNKSYADVYPNGPGLTIFVNKK